MATRKAPMLHSSGTQNRTIVRSKTTLRLTRAALQAAYIVSEELGTTLAERLFTTPRRHARPDRERAVLATARPFVVDTIARSPGNQSTIALEAWRWGHGPVVLLVHGWEGRGSQLGAFVEPLVAAGMSVVAFDAPAHGDSPGRRLFLTDHADAIADVAAAIGPLHGIVAHSFGAAAALLARARNNVTAARNVAIAPNVLIEDAIRRFARLVGLDDSDRAALESSLGEHSGVSIDALALERLADARGHDLLVIHDRGDREVPFVHGERLAAAWSGATLRPTDGLGHRRVLRDPDAIASVVSLLGAGITPPKSDLVREVDRWLDGCVR
jgi:predicted alpha/beta hydrolase family esterase